MRIAEQRGSAYRTRTGWGVRWREDGQRRFHAGHKSRTEALNYYRDHVAPRLRNVSSIRPTVTLAEFIELYLAHHGTEVEPSTLTVLKSSLNAAKTKFGDVQLQRFEGQAPEVAAWRSTLKSGSRVGATKALRQCLDQAIKWGVITKNPARLAGPNRSPKRAEIIPFTKAELDRICEEHDAQGAAIVRFASATGMRPCEWLALEWKDVDRKKRLVAVERTFSRGVLRPYGKTDRSRRKVPLSAPAVDALATLTRRIDTPLIFPGARGEMQHLENWRPREWKPALTASGVGHGNVYTLRHTAITHMLSVGISLHDVARYVGTSVVQISKTYGHLAEGAEDAALAKLDAAAEGLGV